MRRDEKRALRKAAVGPLPPAPAPLLAPAAHADAWNTVGTPAAGGRRAESVVGGKEEAGGR